MLVFALTIFTGAFLLFQVQPMIGKFILPWFGSGPGVWTTCMLFFQLVLLGGYAYAHLISRWLKPRSQVFVHLVVLLLAVMLLPITPADSWKPHDSGDPRWQILLVLTVSVGLPYFALSATGPLIQQWFNRVQPGAPPYRLYALSNAGSLLALLSYPFYFESHFTRHMQTGMWDWGLVAFLVCSVLCAIKVWKYSTTPSPSPIVATSENASASHVSRPSMTNRLLWLLLPACASVLLLATTNKVCQEVTVIPLLWVVPLALYLLSFIVCFDNSRWYRRTPFAVALFFTIGGIWWALFDGVSFSIPLQLGVYSTGLFVCCMVCHGELYRLRPAASQLTSFYLMIAAGGALGGIFVTLIAPLIFKDYDELPWGLLLCAVLFFAALFRTPDLGRFFGRRMRLSAGLAITIAAVGMLVWLQVHRSSTQTVARTRNFYGVLSVTKEDPSQSSLYCLKFYHGITPHGLQLLDPAMSASPTAYYGENSGVGRVLRSLTAEHRRIGVIGLGAGTLATYARKGDYLRMYEINPEVERLARTYFTYLTNCAGTVEVKLGDARLSLEKESPQNLDLLVMDAFSSDAIPMHLLTQEAFALYQQHLKPSGIIAVHISNRYLNLEPVIANVAEQFNYHAGLIFNNESPDKWWLMSSTWIVLSRDEEIFRNPLIGTGARAVRPDFANVHLWTDDYASLYPILRFERAPQKKMKPGETQAALATDLSEKGDIAGAIAQYRAALRLNPDYPEALNNFAWLLATTSDASLRNGAEAVQLAEHACQLTEFRRTTILGTLAAAYAEAGRFSDAVTTAEKACALASESGDAVLLARNRELLELYRGGKPYHEPVAPTAGK